MGLVGKYEYQSNEKLKEMLLHIASALGKDGSKIEEYADKFSEVKSTLEIIPEGTKYTLISTHLGKEYPLTFELGQEFVDNFYGNPKSTATVDGDVLVIKSSSPTDGKIRGKREYVATAEGLTVTLRGETSGREAKIVYRRL